MMPLDFKGVNYRSIVPDGFKHDCIPMPGMRGVDKDGNPYVMMQFMPNKEDIEAILAGRPVCVNLYSHEVKHPISVYTFDENLKVNI